MCHTYESQLGITVRAAAARVWNSTRSGRHNGARNEQNIPHELFLVIINAKSLIHTLDKGAAAGPGLTLRLIPTSSNFIPIP